MRKLFMGAVALSLSVSGAIAQPTPQSPCGSLDEMMNRVINQWNEEPVAAGLSAGGHIMQLFAHPDSGAWTVLITNPVTGETCVVDYGVELMRVPVQPNV